VNNTIAYLYQMAFGQFKTGERPSFVSWNRVIIESRDSSILRCPSGADCQVWPKSHNYSYDLIVPHNFKGDAHDLMKEDLKRVFNYDVKLEKRKTICLVFRRGKDGDKLISTGNQPLMEMKNNYLKMQNASWREMMFWLENKFLGDIPFVDETGYERVTLDLNSDLSNTEKLIKDLKPVGIDVTIEEKDIDMLVIRDKQSHPDL
jgi:hypothetical protein